MFKILGLVAKESFADGEQPVTNPDPILLEKKRLAKQRELELEAAKSKVQDDTFEPRKVRTVDSL